MEVRKPGLQANCQRCGRDRGKSLLLLSVQGENSQTFPKQLHLLTSPFHILPAPANEICPVPQYNWAPHGPMDLQVLFLPSQLLRFLY